MLSDFHSGPSVAGSGEAASPETWFSHQWKCSFIKTRSKYFCCEINQIEVKPLLRIKKWGWTKVGCFYWMKMGFSWDDHPPVAGWGGKCPARWEVPGPGTKAHWHLWSVNNAWTPTSKHPKQCLCIPVTCTHCFPEAFLTRLISSARKTAGYEVMCLSSPEWEVSGSPRCWQRALSLMSPCGKE